MPRDQTQRALATERSVAVRSAQRDELQVLMRATCMAESSCRIAAALRRPNDVVKTIAVRRLLLAGRGFGDVRVRRLLIHTAVLGETKVGAIPARKRNELADALSKDLHELTGPAPVYRLPVTNELVEVAADALRGWVPPLQAHNAARRAVEAVSAAMARAS